MLVVSVALTPTSGCWRAAPGQAEDTSIPALREAAAEAARVSIDDHCGDDVSRCRVLRVDPRVRTASGIGPFNLGALPVLVALDSSNLARLEVDGRRVVVLSFPEHAADADTVSVAVVLVRRPAARDTLGFGVVLWDPGRWSVTASVEVVRRGVNWTARVVRVHQ
jgi:hypothetical protein